MRKNCIDLIWMGFMEMGKSAGCHQRPNRSFSIGRYQFPICARCTGIFVSTIAAYIMYSKKSMCTLKSLCMMIPMAIDGILQSLKLCESNNCRRFITGFMGGYGCTYIRLNCLRLIIHTINMKYNKRCVSLERDC